MSPAAEAPKTPSKVIRILVLGDVHLDTLVLPVSRTWNSGKENWWRVRRRGGAWLLQEIIQAAIEKINEDVEKKGYEIKVESYDHKANGVENTTIQSSLDKEYQSSAAILGLFPKKIKSSRGGDTDRVYRVERLLGWIHTDKDGVGYARSFEKCLKPYLQKGTDGRDILVFHDKARDFRSLDSEKLERVLQRHCIKGKTWIVWHMDSPLTRQGNHLWQIIKDNKDWLERTVVVVKEECLRQAGANLPEIVSLEGESEKFMDSMRNPPKESALADLAEVGHLIVHAPRQGVLYAGKKGRLNTSCYYCPNLNNQSDPRRLGTVIGYTSILVASIVRGITWSLMCDSSKVSRGIIDGIKQGVILDHLYYLYGYGERNAIDKATADQLDPYGQLFCKYEDLAKTKNWNQGDEDYRLAALPLPPLKEDEDLKKWSRITGFLERKFRNSKEFQAMVAEKPEIAEKAFVAYTEPEKKTWVEYTETVLQELVRCGLEKVVEEDAASGEDNHLPGTPERTLLCPFETHGKIKTAFRDEIERFASIRRIIEKYLYEETWTSPLSIAVFGPPGSGKSFTIRQLLKTINPDIPERSLEFNVAQFTDLKDLETAFHKVQDVAVGGGVPLVFFDEFDTNFRKDPLGWLKFFLAPMQDGKFKAGESTYRIGRAIFVFAGGISESWTDFYEKHSRDKGKTSGKGKDESPHNVFRNAKGPDFVSRLRGYLNIASINCPDGENNVDPILMFRRAVLLRSLLEDHLKEIFDKNTQEARIEPDLLRAFLTIPRYEHESRSMQAILEMSRASPRGRFQKSSLPASEQLKMHVDAEEFFKCMDSKEFFKRIKREQTLANTDQLRDTGSWRHSENLVLAENPGCPDDQAQRTWTLPTLESDGLSSYIQLSTWEQPTLPVSVADKPASDGVKPTSPPEKYSKEETTDVQQDSVHTPFHQVGEHQSGPASTAGSPPNEEQPEDKPKYGNA